MEINDNNLNELPELIKKLLAMNKKVSCYSGDYYWLDIGRVDDYEQALEIYNQRKNEFLYEE